MVFAVVGSSVALVPEATSSIRFFEAAGSIPVHRTSPMTTTSVEDQAQDKIMEDGDIQAENQKQEKGEASLPPLASGNGVNVWFSREADKNGDQYLVIDMPGHQPVRVFFNDDAKPTMNKFAESWREKRKDGGGQ